MIPILINKEVFEPRYNDKNSPSETTIMPAPTWYHDMYPSS